MILTPNREYTGNAFLDVQSFDAAEARGITLPVLRERILDAARPWGMSAARVEVTRNPVVADVVSIAFSIRPIAAIDTGVQGLGGVILAGANGGQKTQDAALNPRSVFVPHTARGTALGIVSSLLTAGTTSFDTLIVDDSTLREGNELPTPRASSSSIGTSVGAIAGARTASEDSARNNGSTRETAPGLPWYAVAGIVAGAAIVAAVAVGYAVRSFK